MVAGRFLWALSRLCIDCFNGSFCWVASANWHKSNHVLIYFVSHTFRCAYLCQGIRFRRWRNWVTRWALLCPTTLNNYRATHVWFSWLTMDQPRVVRCLPLMFRPLSSSSYVALQKMTWQERAFGVLLEGIIINCPIRFLRSFSELFLLKMSCREKYSACTAHRGCTVTCSRCKHDAWCVQPSTNTE